MIPLAAIGPSWALWPTLSDLATALLFVAFISGRRYLKITTKPRADIFRLLLIILAGNIAWLVISGFVRETASINNGSKVASFGIFQIYRLAQFALVFRVAAGVPLTHKRQIILSRILGATLLLVFFGLIGTYTSIIPTQRLVAHLPSDFNTAGQWAYLAYMQIPDVGTIGYNHAYIAIQLIMLTGLALNLRARPNPLRDSLYLLICIAGVFLSGSRAGMAAVGMFSVMFFLKQPSTLLTTLAVSAVLLTGGLGLIFGVMPKLGDTVSRQLTLEHPLDPSSLSGRQDIWMNSLAFLNEDPVRWIVGAGPGSAALLSKNAHMLYLHVVLESGVVGLFMFGILFYTIIVFLRKHEAREKPILMATWALLFASFTQETFYPVPAFGHFIGLYLFSLAIALRPGATATRPIHRSQLNERNNRHALLQ